ncbi:hypothetical protein TCA2_5993 [Paenibacillus sp. TCA20]|uniref:hypothetical protein n=1 Tax=Paenibacillus sp. TCA20 TaxID=1499968 RepID=UPI0004D69A14|nr:hypothetical protein [Paenibacillus sp. TCA20]GAK43495.1 hypothetical protein TCA2_5993 [Paenibacillus sp. TCA20]
MQLISIYFAIGSIISFLFLMLLYGLSWHSQRNEPDDIEEEIEMNKLQGSWDNASKYLGGDMRTIFLMFVVICLAWPGFIIYLFKK